MTKNESNNATGAQENREVPHVFGDYRNLMGVMNTAGGPEGPSDAAVIMVTAGMLNQVGPFRLHVELARSLSDQGIPSLRFDLSGIGESLAVGTAGSSLLRASAEIRDAMDLIQAQYGIEKFVLFGLCSGADDSFFAAQEDDRVCGVVMMDGCGYKTSRHTMHKLLGHYLRRAVSPQRWIDSVNRRFNQDVQPATIPMGSDIREFPEQREAALQIQKLVSRDVRMRFIYTGGVAEYYNYERQFWDMFADVKFNEFVSTIFFPEMDHVAFLEEDRRQLIADITAWAVANFGANKPAVK